MAEIGLAPVPKRREIVAIRALRLIVGTAQLIAIAVPSALVAMVVASSVAGSGPARAAGTGSHPQAYDVMWLDDPTAEQLVPYIHAGWESFHVVPYDCRCGSPRCGKVWYLRRPLRPG